MENISQKIQAIMTKFWPWLDRNIKLCAYIIVAVFGLMTVVGFSQVIDVKTQYNLRQFFPSYHPLLRQDEIVTNRFHLNESSPFLLVATLPKDQNLDWSNKESLDAVKKLTEKIKLLPQIVDVKDISNLQGAVPSEGSLGIGTLVDYLTPATFHRELSKNPILSPLFISKDAKTLTIFVLIKEMPTAEVQKLKEQLTTLANTGLPFATINVGGVPAIQSDVNQIIKEEVVHFIIIAAIMSLLALALIFKNWTPVVICTLVALITNIISVWGIIVFGFSFNILSSTIPILVTMTVISICIHSILRLIERVEQADLEIENRTSSLSFSWVVGRTFAELFRPNLLTALTTSVGFFTLTFCDSPIIKEFGLSVGIALLVTWLTTALLLPAMLILTKQPKLRGWMGAKARWPFWVFKHHQWILFTLVILAAAGGWRGQYLSWGAKLFDDLPADHAVRRTTELVDRSLGGLVPLDIEVRMLTPHPGVENPWSNEELITNLDSVGNVIRHKSGVGSVVSVADILRASGLRQGQKKAAASEVMFLLSMSGDNPLAQYVSADGLSTRLSIRLRDIPGYRMWHLVQDIRKTVQAQFPDCRIRIAGTAAYVHDINNALSKDLLYGFWQAMLVIFILLVISYRSFTWAILACVPNLTPPALLLGALSLWKIPIKPGIAIILSISLGLAFNNTVYLLERMRHLIVKGHSLQKSLQHTFWSEANPCFFSSLVLVVGFAGFAVSYFKMNQLFGIFMVLSVLAGLLGDLVMLPALLQFILNKRPSILTQKTNSKHKVIEAVAVLAFLMMLVPSGARAAAATAAKLDIKKLGEMMRANIDTKDESGVIDMSIIEADGGSKKRQISYSRMNDADSHYTMVKLLAPKDMKGTSLLSVIKGGTEEKWVYLPTSKQTRKITTSQGNARVLDSELYTEDFDLAMLQGSSSLIARTESDGSHLVESKVTQAGSSYSKSSALVNKDNLITHADVYDKKGALLKRIDFQDYKQVGSGGKAMKYRAGTIKIENVQTKRKTELHFSDIKVNQNLNAKNFTPSAMSL